MVGRWAPSPTGDLHLGSAATALLAWLSVRSQAGRLIWRVEDIDGPRSLAGVNHRQMEDLGWLGLDWDEGPDLGGPSAPYRQSECDPFYVNALRRLDAAGRVFPCNRSRKELQDLAAASPNADHPYPKALRPEVMDAGWLDDVLSSTATPPAVRFRVDDGPVAFRDRIHGEQVEDVGHVVGDFVLRRRDRIWAYQLAVVVDDGRQGVTEVVRGADLLSSTARQILLQQALDIATPQYAHGPVFVDDQGVKLSKRHGSLSIRALRERCVTPVRVVAALARAIGLHDGSQDIRPVDLVEGFRWDRVRGDSFAVTDDWLHAEALH